MSDGCDSYSVVALPDEGSTVSQSEMLVALSSSMDVYAPLKNELPLDEQMMTVENAAAFSECPEKDVDIEKGRAETPSTFEETAGNLKTEEEPMKLLPKQISFEIEGKYMQLLMNQSLILPKFSTRDKTAAEKGPEAPRMRKYKRVTSFNSRKVAFLFSVLSSFGTIILIYLTLRVKQIADASLRSE
uniref:uncharacterized protein LOC122588821 isoform X2 n=1 Tax=Erigeron canadensis TaxID=72917 RepID=UPI001CB9632E|nr:uncharacterized protein LOC122588821 isoform X2 [Erigeron canadensis]